MEFIACLHKDKNSHYGVSFPALPAAMSAGAILADDLSELNRRVLDDIDAIAAHAGIAAMNTPGVK